MAISCKTGTKINLFGLSSSFIIAFIVSAAIFICFSEIDISISKLFYNPVQSFYLKNFHGIKFVYSSVELFTVVLVVILLVLLIGIWISNRPIMTLTKKKVVYLLLVLIMGPGFIINVVFKDHWGRARPAQIEQFGGTKKFSPAFIISRECDRNCSFVSGHASMGFYLIAVGLLIGPPHRKKIITVAIICGALIGLVRITQGGHFISDVIFSFFFIYGVSKVTYYFMFEKAVRAK